MINKTIKKLSKLYPFIPTYKVFKKVWNAEVKRLKKESKKNNHKPEYYVITYFFDTDSIAPIKALYRVNTHFNFILIRMARKSIYYKIVNTINDFYMALVENESPEDVEKYIEQMNFSSLIFEDLLV